MFVSVSNERAVILAPQTNPRRIELSCMETFYFVLVHITTNHECENHDLCLCGHTTRIEFVCNLSVKRIFHTCEEDLKLSESCMERNKSKGQS